ncbi:MAG: Bax inhibitor-1/YccA family protein [Gammaproteobacteria bacterium]
MPFDHTLTRDRTLKSLAINKVLRNTYLLLAMTLAFSALTATLSMTLGVLPLNPLLTILIYFALLFATSRTQDSAWGIVSVFALTGFLGFTLGPILNFYIHAFSNGTEMVATALGGTAIIFFSLSAYAVISRKDFSFMTGFLFVGVLVAFLASLASLFFRIPALQLAVSAAFVFLSSGLILWQTSAIINGGERNYISATVTLYVSLFNLFLNLLNLLAALSGRD